MPSEESKLYLDLKGKLENFSDGVKKHSAEAKFPSNITAEEIDAKVAQFVQKKRAFDEASNLAHQKSEEYAAEFDECEKTFSQLSSQIYGYYGKQNLVVEDFGLRTYQKPGAKRSKVETPAEQ